VVVVDNLHTNHIGQLSANGSIPDRERKLQVLRHRLDLLRGAGVSLLTTDASDRRALTAALSLTPGDIVVHLAAVAHADRADREPHDAFQCGLASLAATLDLARTGVRRFVYFSSSMVYGEFESPVATEDQPLRPKGMYGTLKLAGEMLVRTHQRLYDLPGTIIRPCALYGPRCISGRVTQRFVENARDGRPLLVEGTGAEAIDFTYIDDLVAGTRLAMTADAAINETFNLTCGRARTLLDLARLVQQRFPNTPIQLVPRDASRPVRGTLAIDKARDLLGYAPQVQLEDGIDRWLAHEPVSGCDPAPT
jgi:nucleoside-diphosphate-sugar epimerase